MFPLVVFPPYLKGLEKKMRIAAWTFGLPSSIVRLDKSKPLSMPDYVKPKYEQTRIIVAFSVNLFL